MAWKPPAPWMKANPKDQPDEGGQAYIFQVVRPEDQRLYALKRLKNKKRRSRFVREVEVMEQLSALGFQVPPVVAKYLDDDNPCFVMPWYPDGSLEEQIAQETQSTLPERLALLVAVGTALQQIHSVGKAHRDIKPSNILRVGSSVLLADFGLCLGLEDERLTRSWEVIGPRNFVAPENEAGINEDVDQRPADCYAYGKLCWSLLAGRQALPRERQLDPANRLEVLTTEAELSPLGPLFELLLDRDPRTRLTDWNVILPEIRRVSDRIAGTRDVAATASSFDLETAVARARQLAANEAMVRQRSEQLKERERSGREAMLRRLVFLDFKAELEEAVGKINSASDGSLQIQLGTGRSMGDQTSQELIDLINVEPLPPQFFSEPAATSLLLSRWGDSDGSSVFQLLVLLVRREENVWLIRVPMRRRSGYEYPLLATGLPNMIDRVGPIPLRLDSTKQRIRNFVTETADLGLRVIGRYIELAQIGAEVWDDVNWRDI
ncbi:serine/threonine protein kinase [Micromonospora chersina]|uniref:serine/threonine protein kinase n=1 Tax=Micromonospora chersina TaxID=47854 RepID=UPI003D94E6AF